MPTFHELFGDKKPGLQGTFDPQPVTLESSLVRLEPLKLEHAEALTHAGRVSTIWRYLRIPHPKTVDDTRAWIKTALENQKAGTEVPLATIHKPDNRVVGTTRFMDIRREHKGLEIGWTWIDIEYQRTFVNTHAKFLMFEHAFEKWGAIRVQLKTDSRNAASRKAIERVGARFEGVLRNHMINFDGYVRDSVMFSIIAKEWPDKKKQLQLRLL
jgi:RimJ/RimL family protein N-acetyltransferase